MNLAQNRRRKSYSSRFHFRNCFLFFKIFCRDWEHVLFTFVLWQTIVTFLLAFLWLTLTLNFRLLEWNLSLFLTINSRWRGMVENVITSHSGASIEAISHHTICIKYSTTWPLFISFERAEWKDFIHFRKKLFHQHFYRNLIIARVVNKEIQSSAFFPLRQKSVFPLL